MSAKAAKAGAVSGTSARVSAALSARAASRWRRGRRGLAIEDAHRAVLLDPDNLLAFRAFLSLSRGLVHNDGLANRPRLYAAADDIIRKDPSCAWARAARVALTHTSDYQVGVFNQQVYTDDLQHLTRLEPSRVWVWAFLGRICRRHKELDKAVEAGPEVGWVRAWRGELRRNAGPDPKGAMEDYDDAIRLDPNYLHTFAWRARLRDLLGDKTGALADLERFTGPEQRAFHLQHRATLLWGFGEDARCLEDLKDCMIRSPLHSFAYGGLYASIPESRREYPRGYFPPTARRIERLARRQPAFALAHAWLGRLSLDAGRLAAARSSLEKAVRLDPGCCLAQCWLGECLFRTGRRLEALRTLNESLRLEPRFYMALLWRVKAAAALKKFSIAALDLQTAANVLKSQHTDAPKTDLADLWRKHSLSRATRKALETAEPRRCGPTKHHRRAGVDASVDGRVELLSALDCLTKPNPCPLAEESHYRTRLLAALDKDHPACRLYASLGPASWNNSRPAAVLLQCSPLPQLAPRAAVAAVAGLERLLAAMRDFAAGGFLGFMRRERALHASLIAPIRELFSEAELLRQVTDYLGIDPLFRFHVLISPLYHGMLIEDIVVSGAGGGWNGYMVNGHTNIGLDSEPVAAVDEYSIRRCAWLQAARCALQPVAGADSEALAQAVARRLTTLHWGEPTAASMLSESRQGSRVAELSQRLADYERRRGKYPTIREFIEAQKQSVHL